MTKGIILTIAVTFLMQEFAYSQRDTITLAGHNRESYKLFFDSINTISKSTIESLNHSYNCWVVLKIDNLGKIRDVELIEIPETPLPPLAADYIKYIFNSTSGKWSLAKKDQNLSGDIIFTVSLKKTGQALEDYMKDMANVFEFTVMKLSKLPRFRDMYNNCDISLTLHY